MPSLDVPTDTGATSAQVRRLELERLGGLPRWHVSQDIQLDSLPVIAARRRALDEYRHDDSAVV